MYDYIIVGSGAGGAPLAARLALAGKRVLVLEAGGNAGSPPAAGSPVPPAGDEHEVSLVPSLHGVSTEHPELSWRYFVKHYDTPPAGRDPKWHTPDPARHENETHEGIFYPRATGIGGCTIHNALITIAGPDSDWDELADTLGDDSWRASRMRHYFQKMERNEYTDLPTDVPDSWWGRAWDGVKWLLSGRSPDHSRGRHGFDGWLRTSVVDLSIGLGDKQLLGMIAAALEQSKQSGLERAGTLVKTILRGEIFEALDPNHARTQAESPDGLALIPLAVCGKRTTPNSDRSKPNVQRGRRSSPREFLLEAQSSLPEKNLEIRTDCLVTRLLFDEGDELRVVGVEYRKGKKLYRAHVAPNADDGELCEVRVVDGGEVILCGGAFNTPQLLMLSGIGDRTHLEEETVQKPVIPCRVHSPGVGRNLQDRYEVTVISEMNEDFSALRDATFRPADRPAGGDRHLREWREKGTGLYTSNGAILGIFKRSRPELPQPDLFIFGIPLPFEGYQVGYSNVGNQHNLFTWAILKAHTRNNDGTVRLRTGDPRDTPDINFHYFNEVSKPGATAEDPDLDALVDGVRFVRGIAEHAHLVVKGEQYPGSQEVTAHNDGQIKDWCRRVAWGHHACGTCRMGKNTDSDAVLDSRFRVLGNADAKGVRHPIPGLRVVDTSIFPRIPGVFIVANIYMASEKAADVILEDSRKSAEPTPHYPAALRAVEGAALQQRRSHLPAEPAAVALATGGDWPEDVTGLAVSGGGIRSATFSLGILQAMARFHWLRRIDFMATVSGGGYAGTFLGRFYDRLKRPGQAPNGSGESGPEVVERELSDPNSKLIGWLRRHGNYISPGNGDTQANLATYLRNLLSVQFVVGLLLFALFGVANGIRYGIFDPTTEGLGFLMFSGGQLPLGHLLDALLGPFNSPWFVVFELLLLFLVVPRSIGYWVVSQDRHERFQPVGLALVFILGGALLLLGVRDGLTPEPLVLGLSAFCTLIPVEMAWRRGRVHEEAHGTGGPEVQRLRTRNYLSYDLGLVLTLTAGAFFFAVVDSLGHGLQQWIVEGNRSYAVAFASIGAALSALTPVSRLLAGMFSGDSGSPARPPSAITRILKVEVIAGLMAAVFLIVPLTFHSFAAHAVYQGGSQIWAGLAATGLAVLLLLLFTSKTALTFVNRSSLSQIYASRLSGAYLGASNPLRHQPAGADVTTVITGDDVPSIRDYQPHAAGGPFHLLNLVVNQTSDFSSQRGNRDRQGENLAVSCLGMTVGTQWHGLWADPLFSARTGRGLRRTTRIEPVGNAPGDVHPLLNENGKPPNCAEMLSLRQWMALSGAAIGPGAGQQTRLGTALLLGLANMRTGYWWNSGLAAAARDGFPNLTPLRRILYLLPRVFQTHSLLLSEWLARFAGPWEQFWNLSDGGLLENTGVYELVRRRVPRMILCDGSADPSYQFDSFAELTRKVRLDFGACITPFTQGEIDANVPSELARFVGTGNDLQRQSDGSGGQTSLLKKHAALYWVHYQSGPVRRSLLLFLKASLTGDESSDVENWHVTHPEFPHESTGDQNFEEPQWESYRKLGEHVACPLMTNPEWFWAIPLEPSNHDACC